MATSKQQMEALKYFKAEIKSHQRCVNDYNAKPNKSGWEESLRDSHKKTIRHMVLAMEAILELK